MFYVSSPAFCRCIHFSCKTSKSRTIANSATAHLRPMFFTQSAVYGHHCLWVKVVCPSPTADHLPPSHRYAKWHLYDHNVVILYSTKKKKNLKCYFSEANHHLKQWLSLYLPTVVHYAVSLRSHISSCSCAFRCFLTPSSGKFNPTSVPSKHIGRLWTLISCLLNTVVRY